MPKAHTTLTVDEQLIEQAKARGMNISGLLNDTLEKALRPKKENLPENSKKVFCCKCKKEIKKGYVCRQRDKVWCDKCHNGNDAKTGVTHEGITMLKCFHDGERQHEHERWEDKDAK